MAKKRRRKKGRPAGTAKKSAKSKAVAKTKAESKAESKPKAETKASDEQVGREASGLAGWWPHIVGAFVIFHVLANMLAAIPNVSRAMNRRAWDDPRIQREMRIWSERVGWEQEEFQETLYGLAVGYQETRLALNRPFEPYTDLTGLRQSWLMFGAGTSLSDRFGLRVRDCEGTSERCAWRDLFVHADPEHDWRAAQLSHPRIRSMIFRWGWPGYRGRYEVGCVALARLAFEDFEEVQVVQCRFEQTTLRSPDNPSPPPPVWSRAITIHREDVE